MRHHAVLDSLGSVFSTLSTGLYVIASSLAWPVALIAILINGYLYAKTGLFADMGKEVIFGGLTLYGWAQWLRGGPAHHMLAIQRIEFHTVMRLFIIFTMLFILSYWLLQHVFHSKVPIWDSLTTSLSLVAEWMTCRKYIENWLLWGVVDALYVGLYFYKGLPVHGMEMCAYLVVAGIGYWVWHVKMKKEQGWSVCPDNTVR